MAITMTLNKDQFRFQMQSIRPENFSWEGLGELFDYFDSMDPEQIEYDGIAICCDFTESTLDEFLKSYPVTLFKNPTVEQIKEAISEYIGQNGFWYSFIDDGKKVIYENF
jgi:hypothetical protein